MADFFFRTSRCGHIQVINIGHTGQNFRFQHFGAGFIDKSYRPGRNYIAVTNLSDRKRYLVRQ